jgi:Txe/YoeB family toxin of Txe-Axe toxin-antitoxin module
MEELSDSVRKRLLEVIAQAGAVGFDHRLKPRIKGGKVVPGTACIRVFVEKKKPLHELKPFQIIPMEISGIETDVVEIGHIEAPEKNPFVVMRKGKAKLELASKLAIDPTKRVRPLVMGVSVGNRTITAGTDGTYYMKNGEILEGSNAHVFCYSSDTEVFTRDGWKLFPDLTYDDEIATLNEKTGELEFQRMTRFISYPYKGKMLHIEGKFIDLLVTPEHHFFFLKGKHEKPTHLDGESLVKILEKHPRPELFFKKTFDWNCMSLGEVKIPSASVPVINQFGYCGEIPYRKNIESFKPEPFLRFLGWYLTEGNVNKSGPGNYEHAVRIRNTNPHYLKEIAETIKELGLTPYLMEKHGVVVFYSKQLYHYLQQFGYDHERFIPKEFKELKKEQLQILFDTLMKGDGCKTKDGGYMFVSTSKRLVDDVGEIAMKLGWEVKFSIRKGSTFNPNGVYYPIHICKPRPHNIQQKMLKIEEYEGMVYDVTVPNHVILVRRKGKVVFSGNCESVLKNVEDQVRDIVQPGPYHNGKMPDDYKGKLIWGHKLEGSPKSTCPLAGLYVGFGNALARLAGAKTRFTTIVSYEDNDIDFALATVEVPYEGKVLDQDLNGKKLAGHIFAGSDQATVFCRIENIMKRAKVEPAFGQEPYEAEEGDVLEGWSWRLDGYHGTTTVQTKYATLMVDYGEAYIPMNNVSIGSPMALPGTSGTALYLAGGSRK